MAISLLHRTIGLHRRYRTEEANASLGSTHNIPASSNIEENPSRAHAIGYGLSIDY